MKSFLLIDDHYVVTTGLSILLNKEYPRAVIDVCNTGDDAHELFANNHYDLVILDIGLPGEDSSSILYNFIRMKPDVPVLIFSMKQEDIYGVRFVGIGAKGFLSKDATEEEILNAIRKILDGKTYLSESIILKMTGDIIKKRSSNPFKRLSNRELEITQYLVKGVNITKIAEIMNLHTSTVSTHKSKILAKVGVENVVMLCKLAEIHAIDGV